MFAQRSCNSSCKKRCSASLVVGSHPNFLISCQKFLLLLIDSSIRSCIYAQCAASFQSSVVVERSRNSSKSCREPVILFAWIGRFFRSKLVYGSLYFVHETGKTLLNFKFFFSEGKERPILNSQLGTKILRGGRPRACSTTVSLFDESNIDPGVVAGCMMRKSSLYYFE